MLVCVAKTIPVYWYETGVPAKCYLVDDTYRSDWAYETHNLTAEPFRRGTFERHLISDAAHKEDACGIRLPRSLITAKNAPTLNSSEIVLGAVISPHGRHHIPCSIVPSTRNGQMVFSTFTGATNHRGSSFN